MRYHFRFTLTALALLIALTSCDKKTSETDTTTSQEKAVEQPSATPGQAAEPDKTADGTKNIVVDMGSEGSTAAGATAPVVNLPQPTDTAESIHLRYAVVLEGSPAARAPENLSFSTGTRFRLLVAPARDLYLYLIHEGTTGDFFLLNPMPGVASSVDRLAAGVTQSVPLGGWYRFDANTGTERIHVVASPHKVERLELLLEAGVQAHNSGAIEQALNGLKRLQESGYTTTKKTGANYSELILTGSALDSGVLIGTVEMRHQ